MPSIASMMIDWENFKFFMIGVSQFLMDLYFVGLSKDVSIISGVEKFKKFTTNFGLFFNR